MLKQMKVKYLLAVTIAIFGMVGCGEIIETVEDRPTPPADEINYENKGHYVDSNVSGIEYIAKSGCTYVESNNSDESPIEQCTRKIEGNTTVDGAFGFILGEDVTFSVAGLELDRVASKYLVRNGVVITVPENNGRLASFLQSMDDDGNASNGIKIVPEVVQALYDLNVSQYSTIENSSLDIATLVQEIRSKLNENTPLDRNDSTPFDEDSPQKQYQKSSSISLRYVDESEALEHLRTTIAKYKPTPSITVENVIEKIKDIGDNAKNYTVEEIQSKVKAIRKQLDNPLEGDRNLGDIEIAQALVDLSELTNQPYLEDVLTFNDNTENHLSQIIKEMALDNNMSTQSIVTAKEENATHLIEIGKKVTLGVARNIKSISDKLGDALATVPQYYHFTYEGFDIGVDNIETLRATLLAIASKISLVTAYNLGKDDNYKPKTYTDSNKNKYQYTDIDIHKDNILNSEGFGKATNQSSLDLAKVYLTESALILKDMNASLIRGDLNESTLPTQEDIDAYQEVIDYGAKLYRVLADGNGTITVTDNNNSKGEKEELEIAVNRLFKLDTAPKTNDFGTDWAYESCPKDFNLSTEDETKKYGSRFCYPSDLLEEYPKWDYSDYCNLELYAKIKPQSETSSIDELITQIKVGDEVKTGEELINYIFDDNNSGVRDYCALPYHDYYQRPVNSEYTYEKVAGQTYYSVTENGDAIIQIFSALGTNTFKVSPINETPLIEISFSIENGTLVVSNDKDAYREENRLLGENIDGLYDYGNQKDFNQGELSYEFNYRSYYSKENAEAYLGELKNFKYIGSDTSILTAPNGGEIVRTNDNPTPTITWDSAKITTSYVKLYVLDDNPSDLYSYADLASLKAGKTWTPLGGGDIIYNEGSYSVTTEELSNRTGNDYIILITDENETQWDVSNSTFSINP